MINPTKQPRKVLFFLSRDFGELFNANYFVKNSNIDPVFLLPPGLYDVNRDAFSFPVYQYEKAADVRDAVERAAPDVVLLFSGYLYVVNKVLQTEKSLANILEFIQGLGIPIATSDPSLGLLTDVDPTLFNARHPRYRWMLDHFTRTSGSLEQMMHLYLAPSALVSRARHLAYFNPDAAYSEAECDFASSRLAREDERESFGARWLFVLSPEDANVQSKIHGPEAFFRVVCQLLQGALSCGRKPLLIAPQSYVDALHRAGLIAQGVGAVSACNFPVFLDRLVNAEYVFYWNLFSASIVGRVINRRPFFVFDKGHLAYAMKPLLPIALEHFYPGCDIDRLDAEEPIDVATLDQLAEQQREHLLPRMYDNFAGGLPPDEVIEQILVT